MSVSDIIIGVDGGGTKTVAWLSPLDDAANSIVLGRGQSGPGNPRAVGFDFAQANIFAAVEAAFVDAKLPRATAVSACFGLAGAGREVEQQRLASWALDRQIARMVNVTGDAEPILAAASADNCGIALICGTGSLAWGRNATGETGRCGGWGYLLGDEGSAYAIAVAGLQAAMRATDGRGQATVLCERFQAELNAPSTSDLIDRVYAPEMPRERLASLAKVLFEAAKSDGIAKQIVNSAAGHLAEMIRVLSHRLGLAAGSYLLALTGSVILSQEAYRENVLAELRSRAAVPGSVALVTEPVRGAVALARKAAVDR